MFYRMGASVCRYNPFQPQVPAYAVYVCPVKDTHAGSSQQVDHLLGVTMPCLLSLMKVLLLPALLFQYTTTLPAPGSNMEEDDSLVRMDSLSCRRCLFPRDDTDAGVSSGEDQGYRSAKLHARQLGDLEFTNRYAELLKSKAKLSSLCSFLRRMQNSKKSGVSGDTERVNTLMKQYMCTSLYQ